MLQKLEANKSYDEPFALLLLWDESKHFSLEDLLTDLQRYAALNTLT